MRVSKIRQFLVLRRALLTTMHAVSILTPWPLPSRFSNSLLQAVMMPPSHPFCCSSNVAVRILAGWTCRFCPR